jgi:hypothetical protein
VPHWRPIETEWSIGHTAERADEQPTDRVRAAFGLLLMGAVAFGMVVVGWFAIWSRAIGSDEAYLLASLRGWVERGDLYDGVYSQYGPFYYVVFGVPSRLLGLTWTVDAGRVTNLALWITSSFLLGLAAWRLTRRLAFGIAAQVLMFSVLHTLVDEPMHPGALLCLLLACLVANVAVVRPYAPRTSDAIAGGLLAALTLTKVNVGSFAIAAVLFVMLESVPDRLRALRIAGWIVIVALGPAIVFSNGVDDWAVLFAMTYVVAAVAVVIASELSRARGPSDSFSLRWLGGGFALVSAVTLGCALLTGSSVGGLWDGIVVRPRAFTTAVLVPLELPPATWLWLIVLPGAVFGGRAIGRRAAPATVTLVSGLVRCAGGLGLVAFVLGRSYLVAFVPPGGARFSLLPLAALVLVPRAGSHRGWDDVLARRLLAAAAVTQSLHAFPVPGSQVSWALFLAALAGAVVVGDGVSELADAIELEPRIRSALVLAGAGVVVAIVLLFPYGPTGGANAPGRQFVDWYHRYHQRVPVAVAGSNRVRLPLDDRQMIRRASRAIREHCDTVYAFKVTTEYLAYSDARPATGYISSLGLLLTADEQTRVVRSLQSNPRSCVIVPGALTADGALVYDPGVGPFAEYLSGTRWQEVGNVRNGRVLRRAATTTGE